MEILALEDRVLLALNGEKAVEYHEREPEYAQAGPIGLQLHWISRPAFPEGVAADQRVRFRGLWLVEDPEPRLITTTEPQSLSKI